MDQRMSLPTINASNILIDNWVSGWNPEEVVVMSSKRWPRVLSQEEKSEIRRIYRPGSKRFGRKALSERYGVEEDYIAEVLQVGCNRQYDWNP
jgi:hypothetical protein